MSGSLVHLAAVGIQNGMVHGAEYTPFKCKIQKPSSFAREPKHVHFGGTVGYGTTQQVDIDYHADLLTRVFMVLDVEATPTTDERFRDNTTKNGKIKCAEDFMHALVKTITLTVSGVEIEKITGQYLHIRDTFYMKDSHKSTEWTGRTSSGGGDDAKTSSLIPFQTNRFYMDIPFWFTKEHCQALPLVAMHLSKMRVGWTFRNLNEMVIAFDGGSGASAETSLADCMKLKQLNLLGEYVYLDDRSRMVFAQIEHHFLVEQVQEVTHTLKAGDTSHKIKLDLSHMVKCLWWCARATDKAASLDYFDFTGYEDGSEYGSREGDLFHTAQITLNNNERVKPHDPLYYRLVQPHVHYVENVPDEFVYMYSFALYPQKHAPSGALNHSRIENAHLVLKTKALTTDMEFFLYGTNYNIVTIKAGVHSILFSS